MKEILPILILVLPALLFKPSPGRKRGTAVRLSFTIVGLVFSFIIQTVLGAVVQLLGGLLGGVGGLLNGVLGGVKSGLLSPLESAAAAGIGSVTNGLIGKKSLLGNILF